MAERLQDLYGRFANTWNLGKVHVRFVYPKVFHGVKTGDT
jgi:hypothetical protein